MDGLSENQRFHLILADIAMAAAIRTCDPGYEFALDGVAYVPGLYRDLWLAQPRDESIRQQVIALAKAAGAALENQDGKKIADAAQRYGVPVSAALAECIATHFSDRRNRVLTYDR